MIIMINLHECMAALRYEVYTEGLKLIQSVDMLISVMRVFT